MIGPATIQPTVIAAWLEGEFLETVRAWTRAKRAVSAARARVDAGENLPPGVIDAYIALRETIREKTPAADKAIRIAGNIIDAARKAGYTEAAEDFRRKLTEARGIGTQGVNGLGLAPAAAVGLAAFLLSGAAAIALGYAAVQAVREWGLNTRAMTTQTVIVENHLNGTTTTTTTPTAAAAFAGAASSVGLGLLPVAALALALLFLLKRR